MSTKTSEKWIKKGWLAHSIKRMHTAMRWKSSLILLIAMAGWAICGTSYADTIIGSLGAGFQDWTLDDLNTSCTVEDTLLLHCAPYWDYPTNYTNSEGNLILQLNPANVGHCLTKTGGCNGVGPFDFTVPLTKDIPPGTADPPPGTIPFWGMGFDKATDTGGAIDPNFFFKRDTSGPLHATLELQLSNSPTEINEFGWFEINSDGSIGQTHALFCGTPTGTNPPCKVVVDGMTLPVPTPAGTTVPFTPIQDYGYYYRDLSEGNCFVSTLSSKNDERCGPKASVPFHRNHNMAAFTTVPENSAKATFWIAGLNDPGECRVADCNLTLVKVEPVPPVAADLSVVKTDSPDPVTNADNLTYRVTATNNGPNDATGVTLTDTLPNSVLFVSASPGCAELSGVVTCDIGSLANGSNAVVQITVTPTQDGMISNTAQVGGDQDDPDATNSTTSEDTVVNLAQVLMADLSVTKSDSPDPVTLRQNLTYTVTVTNNGPNDATGVTLTDTLPAGVSFVSASAGCAQASGVVSCTIGNVGNGASTPIQIVVTPKSRGTISNTAQVSANENDPATTNNTATEQTTVSRPVTCGGRQATIIGKSGNNMINGTLGRDIINGLGGNDIIRGRRGNDVICGGRGRDRLFGQRGNDALIGGRGNDICSGGRGRDTDGGCETRFRIP